MTCEGRSRHLECARLPIARSRVTSVSQIVLPNRKWWVLAAAPAVLGIVLVFPDRRVESAAGGGAPSRARAEAGGIPILPGGPWRDRFGDGWPDAARLDSPSDRENFRRWLTYLAESIYYQPSPLARAEVTDCSALVRYAYRNSLMAHTPAWRQSVELGAAPGFGDVGKFAYPDWPLAQGLFRTEAGPFVPEDLARRVFQEFADAQSLMRYNTFAVSREIRAARPGDVMFFHQPEQAEPFHVMLFVGHSHYQPEGEDWIVYHTGSVNGAAGEVRHVQSSVLTSHPEPRWRPLEANPRFLGVHRFNILR